MMNPPEIEADKEMMSGPEIAAAQEMTIPEVKEAPEIMVTTSKETLEVSSPEVSVPEIKAPVMESPKVPSLEVPDVTPSKMEAILDMMEAQEVTATPETLVLSDVLTPPQMFISEEEAVPKVTESTKFTAGLGKIEALLPLKPAAGPERSVPVFHVNVDATSNNGLETSENTEDVNMEPQEWSCSELKALKVLAPDDLDMTEPEVMIVLEDVTKPDVTLAPEWEAQETTADAPEDLCEVPMSVPPEDAAVREKIISSAETPKESDIKT
ncbi:hypothetical protein QTP86_012690 [Hemibagrus guttatus]|nr:hypothetical protein QTP86_012690 [Hemibagrus guttatus]